MAVFGTAPAAHGVLPVPNDEELAHSLQLETLIRAEITRAGSIPFWHFMEMALYAPGLGYYSAGKTKFGASGDFVTAPELGDLFACAMARSTSNVLRASADTVFLEIGGGSGKFAAAALAEWETLGTLPRHYWILDRSAELRARQLETLTTRVPHLVHRVQWLDVPPEQSWRGVLFANEVIDALPAHRFVMRDGEVREMHVATDRENRLCLVEREADTMLIAAASHVASDLDAPITDGYRSEILPQLPYWIEAVCGTLEAGLVVFVDYGYPRHEFYHPERRDGTLTCHYHHRVHDDALLWPGLQDITTWVDFTALAEAATRAGWPLAGFTSQAQFLLAAGLLDMLQIEQLNADEAGRYALAQQVKRLTLPGEMGERFKVMCFARGIDGVPPAFTAYDQSRRL